MALRGKYPDAETKPQEYQYAHEWVGRRVKRSFRQGRQGCDQPRRLAAGLEEGDELSAREVQGRRRGELI